RRPRSPRARHRGALRSRASRMPSTRSSPARRLLPFDRKQRRARILEQLDLLAVRDLAQILDPLDEVRLDELVEVAVLLGILLLARKLEREPGLLRHPDRPVRALVRAHPAEEKQVV